jgi:RNA recognition motif-containing protein
MSNSIALCALQSAEMEAKAAELKLAAARLKAAALKVEAAAQVSTKMVPTVVADCLPCWNYTSLQNSTHLETWQGSLPNAPVALPDSQGEPTTLMLRNIPNDYNRAMLLELLDAHGLDGRYDFLYLPIDFRRMSSLGYAFVNFVSHADADKARMSLHGFKEWLVASQKVCDVCWGEPLQGLDAHVKRYKNSPVMHHDVPDQFKPLILKNGVHVPFPSPTKRIRPPRSKRAFVA